MPTLRFQCDVCKSLHHSCDAAAKCERSGPVEPKATNIDARHVRHTHAELKDRAWCGAKITALDWAFADSDHVLLSVAQMNLVQACAECLAEIVLVAQGKENRTHTTLAHLAKK